MTTTTKTFAFATTAEGFAATAASANHTLTYDAATGNPAGALKARVTGRNTALGLSYWEWSGTWEDLGVPAGETVSSVALTDASTRCTESLTPRGGTTIGPYEVRDSGGTLIGTLWAGRAVSTTDGAWVSTGAQTAVTIPDHPSSTTIRIRLADTLGTGNNTNAAVTTYDDQVALSVASARPPVIADASLAATATIGVAGLYEAVTGATLDASATIAADGDVSTPTGGVAGDASLTITATITATAEIVSPRSAPVAVTTPSAGLTGDASLAVTATIGAAGFVTELGAAALSASASITAAAYVDRRTGAALAGTASVSAAGILVLSSGATVTATAGVSTTGTVTGAGATATLTVTGTASAAGLVVRPSGATLTGTATVTAAGFLTLPGAATLAATTTITATGTVPLLWGPPSGLTVTPISDTRIDLSWVAVQGASGYDIERSGVVIATDVVGTTYSDTGLNPSTTYTYRARSVRA